MASATVSMLQVSRGGGRNGRNRLCGRRRGDTAARHRMALTIFAAAFALSAGPRPDVTAGLNGGAGAPPDSASVCEYAPCFSGVDRPGIFFEIFQIRAPDRFRRR